MPDGHVDVVARIKAELEARKVSLVGPCGAFQIVKRVAWELRGEGAGLLAKPGGNNCEGFAVDIICYPDGRIFDILANGGGDEDAAGNPIPGTGNVPTWNPPSDGQPVDPGRYRRAIDPGDAPLPARQPIRSRPHRDTSRRHPRPTTIASSRRLKSPPRRFWRR